MIACETHGNPWGRLLRIPNLLTVPGDPLAGFVLAGLDGRFLCPLAALGAMTASLCLYAAGLLLNDVADRDVDREERPERPIPAGCIPVRTVACIGAALAAAGLIVATVVEPAAGLVAALLLVSVVLYTFVLRRSFVAASLSMGLCRALSVVLGAVAAGWRPGFAWDPVTAGAACMLLYTAGVTAFARNETASGSVGLWRWLPPGCVAAGLSLFGIAFRHTPALTGIIAGVVLLYTGFLALRLQGAVSAQRRQDFVGRFVRAMLLVQAALCSASPELWWTFAAPVAALPVAVWLGRTYAGS